MHKRIEINTFSRALFFDIPGRWGVGQNWAGGYPSYTWLDIMKFWHDDNGNTYTFGNFSSKKRLENSMYTQVCICVSVNVSVCVSVCVSVHVSAY